MDRARGSFTVLPLNALNEHELLKKAIIRCTMLMGVVHE